MKLWIIVDNDRWGHSTNLVRAETREAALAFVFPRGLPKYEYKYEVQELREGEGIIWVDDVSPDTPPDYD